MKIVKTLVMGAVTVVSLVGVSSASAANWTPQNTNVTATQLGTSHFVAAGGSVTCTTADTVLRASGAVAATQNAANPIAFTGCTAFGGNVTVTTFGILHLTAISTTSVNVTWTPNADNKVITDHIVPLGCDTTVTGEQSFLNQGWDPSSHTLTIRGTVPVEGNGLCALLGSTAHFTWNLSIPALSIT